MVYSNTTFTNLLSKYATWDELSAFLQKEEGGSIRIVRKDEERYAVLRYVKGTSDLVNKDWVAWMRSVIWDTQTNRPVCVSPPKASTGEPVHANISRVEEFAEGVMVNCFWDEETQKVRWATRTSLDANSGFYSTKTFSDMIEETLVAKGMVPANIVGKGFASFVLQHPAHRIVQWHSAPNLLLIHMGSVGADGTITILDHPADWDETYTQLAVKQYDPLSLSETPLDRMTTMTQTEDSKWQGLVFRGHAGQRWRMRSLSYKILRNLRGKEARIEDRFARLRRDNMITTYLNTWSEDRAKFWDLEKRLRALTQMVYAEYCAVHKEHSKVFMDVPVALRTPVYHLHGIYLKDLREKKLTMKMPVVIQYVNNLAPEHMSSMLRSPVKTVVSA
jgi:hypothetical protein